MILACHNLKKSFGDRIIVDTGSFHIEEREKAALVGVNGAGKSTILKMIIGEEPLDGGDVILAKGKTLGYLAQRQDLKSGNTIYEEVKSAKADIFAMEAQIRSIEHELKHLEGEELQSRLETYNRLQSEFDARNGYACESEITGVLKGLGFTEDDFNKQTDTLSGGQKTRVSLGKLLLTSPDILLLDEPTNHLDLNSIAWLETYLINYSGAVFIVSHDRYFLNRVVTKVVEIDNAQVRMYLGNYKDYAMKKQQIRDAQLKEYMNQQREIKHQQAVIEKLKSFNREKSIKRAESREKMLDRITPLDKPVDSTKEMHFTLEPSQISGNDVLTVEHLSKQFDSQVLFHDISFEIKRGEHVAVIGDNGTGKTTLLKIINQVIAADQGEFTLGSKVTIGYYDQEHHVLHDDKTIFDEISDDYPDLTNTQIRNTLAAFQFTGDEVFKEIHTLSGGEKGRVSLAKLMLSEANFLILDEPTNHLDITSKEILEEALNNYSGTILYVSHDRYFINQTASRILELVNQTFVNYIGNYDYYLEKKETQEKAYLASAAQAASRSAKSSGAGNTGTSSHPTAAAGANPTALSGNGTGTSAASSASAVTAAVQAAASASSGKLDWKQQKEEQTRLRKKQNELKRVEEEIHTLETRDQEIDALLCDETVFSDVPRLMELNKEKEELNAKLEGLYEKWEELAE
mgnify:CR=1 FL=1